jgi:hypothetical protein
MPADIKENQFIPYIHILLISVKVMDVLLFNKKIWHMCILEQATEPIHLHKLILAHSEKKYLKTLERTPLAHNLF